MGDIKNSFEFLQEIRGRIDKIGWVVLPRQIESKKQFRAKRNRIKKAKI